MSGDPVLDHADELGLVVGLKHVGPSVARLDIDVLLDKEPETFNLFLIALKELQDEPDWDTKLMSFFQIAGIHGLPNLKFWNGIAGKRDVRDSDAGSGYCEHGTLKFPPWHRPYMSMLEQSLYRKMLEIAQKYEDSDVRASYLKAVEKFRLPYWDYHRPRNFAAGYADWNDEKVPKMPADKPKYFPFDFSVPQVLTVESLLVKVYPKNTSLSIKNPLQSYTFPEPKGDKEALSKDDWLAAKLASIDGGDMTKRTQRWPEMYYANSVDRLNHGVNVYREDGLRIALVLVEDGAYNKYENFATGRVIYPKDPLDGEMPASSLEDLHNNYHNYLGGDPFPNVKQDRGHMTSVPVAAFDPAFWLHHCNIDRIFAVWQAAHDGTEDGWFSEENKSIADEYLVPFIREPVVEPGVTPKCWTANESREVATFGYTYEDIAGLEKGHAKEVQDKWRSKYEWARRLKNPKSGAPWPLPPPDFRPLNLSKSQFFRTEDGDFVPGFVLLREQPSFKAAPPPVDKKSLAVQPLADFDLTPKFSSEPNVDIDEDINSREWYIDMAIQRLALNNAFTISYFIGPREPELHSYTLDPSFAGLSHVFAAPVGTCVDCAEQSAANVKVTATAPITSKLLDYVLAGALPSLKAKDVEPFLVKHLKWRATEVNGKIHDTRELAAHGFDLNVTCKVAPLPGNDGSVVYEAYPQIIGTIIENASKKADGVI